MFFRVVQARRPENSVDNIFFSFLVLNLFYTLQSGPKGFITEKTILFEGSREGLAFSRGWGSNFFQGGGGGSNANFYRNPYNL